MVMSDQPRRGTVVVDLDGTICEHRFPAFGEPIAGARDALQRLKQAGYWIIVHTVRTSSFYQENGTYRHEVNSPEAVRAFLNQHDIPFDEIWMHDKAPAIAYIDDRGLRMVGNRKQSNWQDIADALLPGSRKRRFWQR
jgi:histidinol phosphatase-like enzyme